MARINIEDDIESREEFWELARIVGGDRDAAMGKLVRFFRLAQKFYGQQVPIPSDELKKKGLECMIESGWAVPDGEGYQSLGAKTQFAWYEQKVQAGIKSGETRRRKAEEREATDVERNPTDVEREATNTPPAEPLTPSPAPSSSSTSANDKKLGPIAELAELVGADRLLERVDQESQRGWIRVYGMEMVKEQIPLCYAGFLSSGDRKHKGKEGHYVVRWLYNERKSQLEAASKKSRTDPQTREKTDTVTVNDGNLGPMIMPRTQYMRWCEEYRNGRGQAPPPLAEGVPDG